MDGRPRLHLDGDAQRVRDLVVAHRVEHARQFVAELGKVEVAMRVDEHYIVCVDRVEPRCSPRIRSIVALAAAPVSSSVNWTPMPCVRLPCPPSGVIQTTLPCTAMRFGSSISDSSMNTSSPSEYGRDVGMKMPPPFRNGM